MRDVARSLRRICAGLGAFLAAVLYDPTVPQYAVRWPVLLGRRPSPYGWCWAWRCEAA